LYLFNAWTIDLNRKVREVRDRFTKGANNDKILTLDISPLTVAWCATYEGGDKDTSSYSNDGNNGSQENEGKQQEDARFVIDTIDTIDTIDNGKDRIANNDTHAATDTSHITEQPQTSIMSKMSIMSTSEAPHSNLISIGRIQSYNELAIDRCSSECKRLDFNPKRKVNNNVKKYRPVSKVRLKIENEPLYLLLKTEGVLEMDLSIER
jgi:hypothetical protein